MIDVIFSLFSLMNILDISGLIFGVAGAICVGNKNENGFLFFVVGSFSHGILGLLQSNYGLTVTCIFFIILDIYYFIKWKQEASYDRNADLNSDLQYKNIGKQ